MSDLDMKVRYTTRWGYRSAAYVDLDTASGIATGIDKYTDEPVTVEWIEGLGYWLERPTGDAQRQSEPLTVISGTATPNSPEQGADDDRGNG